MQRPNRHESDGGGAVWIRNQLLPPGGIGVDLRHDQRYALPVSERGRIVDDDGTVRPLAYRLRVLEAEIAVHGEEDHVAFPRRGFAEEFDGHPPELGVDFASGAPLRAENAQFPDGEGAFFEHADNFLADGAGRADHAHVERGGGHSQRRDVS